jgi:type I site-specific restriction endonuclease
MNKKSLSERDICTKYVTPALEKAGWDLLTQIREEVTLTYYSSATQIGMTATPRETKYVSNVHWCG